MFVILLEDIGLNINGIEYDGRFFNVVFWFMKMVLLGGVFKLVSSIVCLDWYFICIRWCLDMLFLLIMILILCDFFLVI